MFRASFADMARMANNQIIDDGKAVNRGLFWDSLHSLYLPYVDIMLTNDNHFQRLSKRIDHYNYKKKLNISPETLKWVPQQNNFQSLISWLD